MAPFHTAASWCQGLLLGWMILQQSFLCARAYNEDGRERYLIMSLPAGAPPGVFYAKLGGPSPTPRYLVFGGLISPGAIAVHQQSARLYVADKADMKIWWYQLLKLPDGKLITDGRKNLCLKDFIADWLAVDAEGSLWMSGKVFIPLTPTERGIFKHGVMAITTGVTTLQTTEGMWNKGNTGAPNALAWAPGGLAADGMNIFWVNEEGGDLHGTLNKAGKGGGGSANLIADNEINANDVVITPRFLFYSTPMGVFGVAKDKAAAGCKAPPKNFDQEKDRQSKFLAVEGQDSSLCPLIATGLSNPKGMIWDGDGTVFVIDKATGVWSFPSGNLEQHKLTKVVEYTGFADLDLMIIDDSPEEMQQSRAGDVSALGCLVFSVVLMLGVEVR